MVNGQTFTITGTTDYPVCDCCGKTNLTRAVAVRRSLLRSFDASLEGHAEAEAGVA